MGYEIEACASVAYQGTKQRISVPMRDVYTYPAKTTEETCATGDTMAEARTNLGEEILDYCQSSFIRCTSHRIISDVTYRTVWSFSFTDFLSSLGRNPCKL